MGNIKLRFTHIDSLRGLAILMVILVHTSQSIYGISEGTKMIMRFGQMGVHLFFVLSAVTLCNSLYKYEIDSLIVKKFYVRRFFRIAPMYYIGIIFYYLYHCFNNYLEIRQFLPDSQYTISNILSNIFFIHGFTPQANNTIVPGGWSIGAEMAFYLIFPVIFILYKKTNLFINILLPFIFLGISLTSIPIIANCLNLRFDNNTFLYYNLLNVFPVFLLGISYFFLLKKIGKDFLISNKILLIMLTMFFSIISYISFTYKFEISLTPFISGMGFILLIELFKTFSTLNNKLLVRTGQLSFSMYIFHFAFAWPISRIVFKFFQPLLNAETILLICIIISVCGSYIVSIYSEKMIEKKCIAYGNYLIEKIL